MPAPSARKLPDRKTLIAEVKAAAKELGKAAISFEEFLRRTGITRYQVYRQFDTYSALLRAAGLRVASNLRIPDDTLLRAMAEIFRREKGVVTFQRFDKTCPYSVSVYTRRWGRWSTALRAFRQWQAEHDPDFPYADRLMTLSLQDRASSRRRPVWTTLGGRRYGDALNFRGLLHTPVNEQGVVFLFATLAVELGFLIESLTSEFPDCEAKRRVGRTWERVRIEFEYESRNFRSHHHDPTGCDLIVCWEHNWDDCPIEVLALKTAVEGRMEMPRAALVTPVPSAGQSR